MRLLALLAFSLLALPISACSNTAKPPPETPPMAFAPEPPVLRFGEGGIPIRPPGSGLAGRTITVSRVSDIALAPGEVVLTFDDGPVPGKTESVLAALDAHRVKATFFMVGQMARSYPALVRKVAGRGHTVGTHTQNHANLRGLGQTAAIAEIDAGIRSVEAALVPSTGRAAPFFRFPYLADTAALRSHLASQGIVPIGTDIDSKDYFQSTPDQVRQRTMERLAKRGSGIILFHDIHQRTVSMLPALLADLRDGGYKVVRLVPGRRGGAVVAALDE